jgi:hypothetical protein
MATVSEPKKGAKKRGRACCFWRQRPKRTSAEQVAVVVPPLHNLLEETDTQAQERGDLHGKEKAPQLFFPIDKATMWFSLISSWVGYLREGTFS